MSRIFFYGLFMDRGLLVARGLHPETVGRGVLHGYRILIGDRATLRPSAGDRTLGIVMELSEREVRALYAEPSVGDYRRELVHVELSDTTEIVDAACWNLPADVAVAEPDRAYAAELARLTEALGFDVAYTNEVAAFARAG